MSDEIRKSYYENQEEEAKREAVMYEETVRLLQTEERFQKFFEGYNTRSVESFIKWYALRRVHWHLKGDSFRRAITSINNKDRDEAKGFLTLIFIKKVFNLKCRWIAAEMDLPFIECSEDFDQWHINHALQQCIGPISSAELECMLQYRKQQKSVEYINMDFDDIPAELALQQFHRQKVMFQRSKERAVPGWFHFYDKHFDTAGLMDLPLIRQELETDYNDLWKLEFYYPTLPPEHLKHHHPFTRKERAAIHADPIKEKEYQEERTKQAEESLDQLDKYELLTTYDDEQMDELMKLCETNEVRSYYKAEREYRRRRREEDALRTEFDYLSRLKHNMPIQSNDDFRESIKELYTDEKMETVNQQLLMVYQEYCKIVVENKPFDWGNKGTNLTIHFDLKKHILEIRKFRGEPENFNFLKKENLPASHNI